MALDRVFDVTLSVTWSLSAPPDPLAGFTGPTSKGRVKGGEGMRREMGVEGKEGSGKGKGGAEGNGKGCTGTSLSRGYVRWTRGRWGYSLMMMMMMMMMVVKVHGIEADPVALDRAFDVTFEQKKREMPDYGIHHGVTSADWWRDVVKRVFINAGHIDVSHETLSRVFDTLSDHFTVRPCHFYFDCGRVL